MCAAAVTTRLLTATALLAIATAAAQERDGFSRLRRTSLTALYRLDRGGEKVETPRYMLELYERYNRAGGRGDRPENTVRSIHAGMGEVNGTAMFIFNLSSIRSTEKMLSAEIHLYKRKSHLLVPKGHVEMSLYELGVDYVNEKGKITLQEASYGWQWRDVTGAVLSCLATSRRRPPRAFGMNFVAERANGKVRPVALKRFSIHHSRPFLIIYSNETESAKLNQLDKVVERLKRFLPGDSDNGGGGPTGVNRTTTGVGADGHATGPAIGGWGNRLRRSILDNEIPQGPADYTPPKRFNFLRTHPNILQTREQGKQKKGSRLIPYPEKSHKRKRRKRRKRKRSRRKMANRHRRQRLPRKWRDHKENESTTSDVSNQSCRKRKLVVNFDDIGWGAWIISPRSFNAHFCAGSCPFPLTKNLRPSNHATIQSIVHAIGLYAGVPAPSCVPNSMSSITLLYFDEDRNVVLKNYPRMTVQSCSCR